MGSRSTPLSQVSAGHEGSGYVASYDDTPAKDFRSINEIYENTTRIGEEKIRELYERNQELLLVDDKATTYEEALAEEGWKQAMESELKSIERNNTWSLTKFPQNRKVIGLK